MAHGTAHRWRFYEQKPPKDAGKERFPIGELARFLRDRRSEAKKYAKSRGLLHHSVIRNHAGTRRSLYWVTPWGAMQVILHVRALQGARAMKKALSGG
jgi:hypothetical protein